MYVDEDGVIGCVVSIILVFAFVGVVFVASYICDHVQVRWIDQPSATAEKEAR